MSPKKKATKKKATKKKATKKKATKKKATKKKATKKKAAPDAEALASVLERVSAITPVSEGGGLAIYALFEVSPLTAYDELSEHFARPGFPRSHFIAWKTLDMLPDALMGEDPRWRELCESLARGSDSTLRFKALGALQRHHAVTSHPELLG